MILCHEDHFTIEDLISEDEVAKQTNITICNVERLLHDDIRI